MTWFFRPRSTKQMDANSVTAKLPDCASTPEPVDAELENLRQMLHVDTTQVHAAAAPNSVGSLMTAQQNPSWANTVFTSPSTLTPALACGIRPVRAKSDAALKRLVHQLPFALAAAIASAEFWYADENPRDSYYRVGFAKGKELRFTNLDTFPTDADIARIAMEAP